MSRPALTSNPGKGQIGVGTLISIGAASALGGVGETWTAIGGITDAKFSGASADVVKYAPLDSGLYTQKLSGIRDPGDLQLEIARYVADAGQIALAAAWADPTGQPYDFKAVLYPNSSQTTSGDVVTMSGIVSKYSPITDIDSGKLIGVSVTIDLVALPAITPGS